jgi:hypothetical protein
MGCFRNKKMSKAQWAKILQIRSPWLLTISAWRCEQNKVTHFLQWSSHPGFRVRIPQGCKFFWET